MSENFVKRIWGPGVWEDEDGALHFNAPDICKAANLPNTAESHRLIEEVLRELLPDAQMIKRAFVPPSQNPPADN